MPNYYLSVLYKHIIQVENKNVGLKVGGHKHTIAPPVKKVAPPPRFLRQCYIILHKCIDNNKECYCSFCSRFFLLFV